MYFNVSQLLKEPTGSTRHYEVEEKLPINGAGLLSHFIGSVAFLKTDGGIWVSAGFESTVRCECSRCLEQYVQAVYLPIEEEYYPITEVDTGARLNSSDIPEDSFYIDQNNVLDLTEALRQYSEMEIPMKPICKESCLGICVNCGVNLNEEQCQCEKNSVDARWGPLLEMASTNDNFN